MTDNEIIKGYDELNAIDQLNFYRNRYYNDGNATEKGIIANALNEILPQFARQKAEIERLQSEIDEQYEIAEANVRAEIASGGTSCHWCEDKVRAEAIKEFAERLKEKLGNTDLAIRFIDNLVKEMVGDSK